MNIVIPMAGRGSRFYVERDKNSEFSKPKPLINLGEHTMIEWALSSLPKKSEDVLIFLVLKEHIKNNKIDEKLKKIYGNSIKIIIVDQVTKGAACTVLLAKNYIDNDTPLMILDTDHFFDGLTILNEIEKWKGKIDGMVPVFYANSSKWSFTKLDESGYVVEIAEKEKISKHANIGVYYFSNGENFVWAAEEMIEEGDTVNSEYYVAPVYNYLIRRGCKIRTCRQRFMHEMGTPQDYVRFLKFLNLGLIKSNFKK